MNNLRPIVGQMKVSVMYKRIETRTTAAAEAGDYYYNLTQEPDD
jgi:hypothetical protein